MPNAALRFVFIASGGVPGYAGGLSGKRIILQTAVGRGKDAHAIDVHKRFEKLVVTLLVMRVFSNFPGAVRACAYFRDPTAVSRIIGPTALVACLIALIVFLIVYLDCRKRGLIQVVHSYIAELKPDIVR